MLFHGGVEIALTSFGRALWGPMEGGEIAAVL